MPHPQRLKDFDPAGSERDPGSVLSKVPQVIQIQMTGLHPGDLKLLKDIISE